MTIRADIFENFIDRRAAAVMRCPAVVADADATPLPIYHADDLTVFSSAARNRQRVGSFAIALREMGVARLGWSLKSFQETGRDRFRLAVDYGHFDARDRCIGQSTLVYYLHCRDTDPLLVMLEVETCPVWMRVQRALSKERPAHAH